MVAFKLLLAAVASRLVTAWPEPTAGAHLEDRAINCAKVTGALSVLKKAGPPATSFCSSFLKIPGTQTTTTTVTPVTVTKTTSTKTVTVTSAMCGIQKRNSPLDYRGFEYARPADVEDIDKRGGGNILGLLAAFAAAKVSEGCSCLNLKPTATKTATRTAATPTTKVVATSTQCVVEPVCKPNGFGNTCTQGSQCCSGTCGATFDSTICCNAVGQYCDLGRPDGCCSGTCLNTGNLEDPDGTCI